MLTYSAVQSGGYCDRGESQVPVCQAGLWPILHVPLHSRFPPEVRVWQASAVPVPAVPLQVQAERQPLEAHGRGAPICTSLDVA